MPCQTSVSSATEADRVCPVPPVCVNPIASVSFRYAPSFGHRTPTSGTAARPSPGHLRSFSRTVLSPLVLLTWLICSPLMADTGFPSETGPSRSTKQTLSVVLSSDLWCPMTCDARSGKPGILVEIIEAVLNRQGYQLDYRTMPWKRALMLSSRGVIDGVIGAYRSDAPKFVFPAVPLLNSATCFFTRQNFNWRYSDSDSLREITLGVSFGYSYTQLLDGYVASELKKENPKVLVAFGDQPLEINLRKLDRHRIDAFAADRYVAGYFLSSHSRPGSYRNAGCLPAEGIYIAFSPRQPERSHKLAKLFSSKRTGKLIQAISPDIWKRYGVDFPAPD